MKNSFYRKLFSALFILFTPLILSDFSSAAQIQLVWDSNSEPDLAGYMVNWGTTPGTYDNSQDAENVTSYALTGLTKGQTYFITIKAYDMYNNDSDSSNEVSGPAIGPPGLVTQVLPSGTGTDTTPTYTWNAVPESSWYYLWVNDSTGNKIQKWYSAVEAGCPDGNGTCSVTPTTEVLGSSTWWVQSSNSAGYGPWSAPLSFAVSTPIPTPPTGATLVSPLGAVTTTAPTYTWNAVSNSTWYYLWVDDSSGNKIQKWYKAAEANCASGTGNCTATPSTEVIGSCKWWIQTYNSGGYGPWSAAMSFSTPIPTPPTAATLVSPSGAITTTTPTYTWSAVSNSTWYYLWVDDSTGNKITKWYTASEANCSSGTGSCTITPTTEVIGSCKWWIQTYNSAGFGPWSGTNLFTAPTPSPPTAVTQIWPSGVITDTTPAYMWNAVSGVTSYQLYVNDSTGNKVQKWFTASEVGCGTGTGTCSVKLPTALAAGSGIWWIQTYNGGGFGPWSLQGRSFAVSPPGQVLTGTATNSTLTFHWNEVSGATWYRLWVNDSAGNNKIQKWYTASDSDCASTGTCSVPSPAALATGTYKWWIQTYGNAGYGPWSAPFSLTVP